ncbi:MAG: UDP-N-acetylglucosamine 3-dehydrogenase [Nitrospirales bacterium]|nr:MAG: UDP-N-acetylglucosamine 3-dehydrogenase [Nitrospirales bacterium]
MIGVGHLGRHHARIYGTLPFVTLVGISDTDTSRGQVVADECGVPYFQDLDELLSLVDAVSVAVPTSAHCLVVTTCLLRGCHVLVEKPIASHVWEGEQLVELAKVRGSILHVGHIERFNPIVEVMRPLVSQPGFIECHRLSPFQPRGTDVDVVRDLMIHDLDLLLSLGLGPIMQVEARGMPVFTDLPDIANVRILFENGCLANLTASRISTGRLRKIRVYQRDRYLSVDFGGKEAVINTRRSLDGGTFEVESQHIKGDEGDALTRELDCFIQSILGNPSARGVSGEEGVEALRVATQVVSLIQQHGGYSPP